MRAKNSTCPFAVGDRVRFTPSDRTIGHYQDIERFGVKVGEICVICEVREDVYLYFDGGRGGWPYTEFTKA